MDRGARVRSQIIALGRPANCSYSNRSSCASKILLHRQNRGHATPSTAEQGVDDKGINGCFLHRHALAESSRQLYFREGSLNWILGGCMKRTWSVMAGVGLVAVRLSSAAAPLNVTENSDSSALTISGDSREAAVAGPSSLNTVRLAHNPAPTPPPSPPPPSAVRLTQNPNPAPTPPPSPPPPPPKVVSG
jgi:hypothetical protein